MARCLLPSEITVKFPSHFLLVKDLNGHPQALPKRRIKTQATLDRLEGKMRLANPEIGCTGTRRASRCQVHHHRMVGQVLRVHMVIMEQEQRWELRLKRQPGDPESVMKEQKR